MTGTTARQLTLAAIAAAAALLAVSGCGGSGEGEGVASAGGKETVAKPAETQARAPENPDAQALVFAGCMRDKGVDIPDPDPGQEGLGAALQAVAGDYDRATLEQAFNACEDLLPQYPQEQQHTEGWMLALAECLREQGLEVSDNPFQEAHSGAIDPGEFAAAMEVCRDVVTGGGQ
jgi:hypothetical protein